MSIQTQTQTQQQTVVNKRQVLHSLESDILYYFKMFGKNCKIPVFNKFIFATKYTCEAIFRLLPALCQSVILRLLFVDEDIEITKLKTHFTIPETEINHIFEVLKDMNLLIDGVDPNLHQNASDNQMQKLQQHTIPVQQNEQMFIHLNPEFKKKLKESLIENMKPEFKEIYIVKEELNDNVPVYERKNILSIDEIECFNNFGISAFMKLINQNVQNDPSNEMKDTILLDDVDQTKQKRIPLEIIKKMKEISTVKYSVKTFEAFLNKLLILNEGKEKIPENIKQLFQDIELITNGNKITKKGYQFLFQEISIQIWHLFLAIIGPMQLLKIKGETFRLYFEMTYLKENIIYQLK